MALFDIPAWNTFVDYPLMIHTVYTTKLPKKLVQGMSETNRSLKELSSYNALVIRTKHNVDFRA